MFLFLKKWDYPYYNFDNPLEYAIENGKATGLPTDGLLIGKRWDLTGFDPIVRIQKPLKFAACKCEISGQSKKRGFSIFDFNLRYSSHLVFVLDIEIEEENEEEDAIYLAALRTALDKVFSGEKFPHESFGTLIRASYIIPSTDSDKNFVFIVSEGWPNVHFVNAEDHVDIVIREGVSCSNVSCFSEKEEGDVWMN